LSEETKHRFGPHGFDFESITHFHSNPANTAYIALFENKIIGYSIIRFGFLEHDKPRLSSYGLELQHETDSTFAPSISDEWQSQGIGNLMFMFILDEMKKTQVKRVILWGGVQTNNSKAVNFYKKHGFRLLGEFEYYGTNSDMVLDL
jgi:ribosomal protein S18 acetylase RimI-like enzyme